MTKTTKIATVWQARNGAIVWKIKRVVYEKAGEHYIRIDGHYYTPEYVRQQGYGVDIGVC